MNISKASYVIYVAIFTGPILIWITWYRFGVLRRNWRILFFGLLTGYLLALISNPMANVWGAWFFDQHKILGWRVINFPIEDLGFATVISLGLSMVTTMVCHSIKYGRLKDRKKV